MARQRLTYRQRDLTAAIRALKAAGIEIARIDVHKDGVTLVPGTPDAAAPAEDSLDAETRAAEEAVDRYLDGNYAARRKQEAKEQRERRLAEARISAAKCFRNGYVYEPERLAEAYEIGVASARKIMREVRHEARLVSAARQPGAAAAVTQAIAIKDKLLSISRGG
jgi:hypothetical protein